LRLKALFVVVVVAVAGASRDTAAQTRPATIGVVPGSRVRVKTPTLVAPLVANFLEQRGDTLVFIEDGTGRGVWSFDIDQIERLEMTAGEAGRNRTPTLKAAGIGAGIGFLAGFLFAEVASPSDSTKQYSKLLTGVLGAGVGAGIGGIVGSRIKEEHWVNVPLPGRGLSFMTNGRGLAISLPLPASR
jgi:hypothetical protein